MEHSLCEKKGQRAVSYRKCVGGWKKYGRADRIKMQMLAWQVVSERQAGSASGGGFACGWMASNDDCGL